MKEEYKQGVFVHFHPFFIIRITILNLKSACD